MEIVPLQIDNEEILVRYLTTKNIKKRNKPIDQANIDVGSVFFDTRGGVSMQREVFCDEQECKERALKIEEPKYIGFIIFKKKHFLQLKKEYGESKEGFEARILPTPLGTNLGIVIRSKEFYKGVCENVSHADLFYLNPAPLPNETPNTSMRSFSRKLSIQYSKIIIDQESTNLAFLPCIFKSFCKV